MNDEHSQTIAVPVLPEADRFKIRRARSPLHILVVEDDPVSQNVIRNVLRAEYLLMFCSNAHEAVSEYLRIVPDLVFLDIDLGDAQFNGFDVLHTINMYDKDAHIIMVTADTSPAAIAKATRAGASGYLMKPFHAAKLLTSVRDCERHKAGRYGH